VRHAGLPSRRLPVVALSTGQPTGADVELDGGTLGIEWMRGERSRVLLSMAVLFLLFAGGLAATLLVVAGRPLPRLPGPLGRIRLLQGMAGYIAGADGRLVHRPRILALATAAQFAVVLCDAATVWALVRSLGTRAPPGGVFASFMSSCLLRTVGFIPSGLGTFEAASVVTLHLVGVPTPVALAATLLFRGLSLWGPMVPGLWFSRRAMAGRQPRQ
jgi:Mg2+-importing ATPase